MTYLSTYALLFSFQQICSISFFPVQFVAPCTALLAQLSEHFSINLIFSAVPTFCFPLDVLPLTTWPPYFLRSLYPDKCGIGALPKLYKLASPFLPPSYHHCTDQASQTPLPLLRFAKALHLPQAGPLSTQIATGVPPSLGAVQLVEGSSVEKCCSQIELSLSLR